MTEREIRKQDAAAKTLIVLAMIAAAILIPIMIAQAILGI